MQTLHFTILINAPRKKVWEAMLQDQTYRQWTSEFMEGSQFRGSWDKGAKIQFVSPDDDGKMSGMTSRIADNRLYEKISIEHLGIIHGDREDTESEEAREWKGREIYTFTSEGEATKLTIELDTPADFKPYMNEAWPKALQKLKSIAEA